MVCAAERPGWIQSYRLILHWLARLAAAVALVLALPRFHQLLAILGPLLTAIAVFYSVLWLSGGCCAGQTR